MAKSNKTIMDLAVIEAKKIGPRTLKIAGENQSAFYLTWDEIMKIHYNEGIENETTIRRRTTKWLYMDDGFCENLGPYWIVGIYRTDDKMCLEEYTQARLNTSIRGIVG